jgi:uncharacterized Fe-S center protein
MDPLADCCLEKNRSLGEDKFRDVYPHIDWSIQLGYAEELGLGSREYKLAYVWILLRNSPKEAA